MTTPDLFNDVYGPIMQPGSSSHTAGPCRLGYLASALLSAPLASATVVIDPGGSFSGTLGLMAEDLAMLAGALGMLPDDPRLFKAEEIAAEKGVEFRIERGSIAESSHPNALKFVLRDEEGHVAELVGESIGGGRVRTRSVNGFVLESTGDAYVAVLPDRPFLEIDQVAAELGLDPAQIVERREVPAADGRRALALWCSARPLPEKAADSSAGDPFVLPPVCEVIRRSNRPPALFSSMAEWRTLAEGEGASLAEIVLRYEETYSGWSRGRVLEGLKRVRRAMDRQVSAVYEEDFDLPGYWKVDYARAWREHARGCRLLNDPLTAEAVRLAYGAGAGLPGVPTVAGPWGGGGGYIYAALRAAARRHGYGEEDLLSGLATAGGVGIVAFNRTEPTGEVTGCSGETGVTGAMAAAGLVQMVGGSPAECEAAASLALQASMGVPCDPVAGGRGQPCRSRALSAVTNALLFADLALAGHQAMIPLDQALDVLDAVGRNLPEELRCTSRGGLAVTPAALAISERSASAEWVQVSPSSGVRFPGNLV